MTDVHIHDGLLPCSSTRAGQSASERGRASSLRLQFRKPGRRSAACGFPAPCSPRVASEPVGAHETLEGVAALQKCPERCQPALLVPGVPAAQVSLPRLAAGPQRQACGAGEPGSPAHASRGLRPCPARRCLRTSSDPPLRAPHSWRGRGATSAGAQREVALPAP